MRKVLVSLIALLAIALMPGVASATHSNGQGPAFDFVSGSGKGPLPTPFGTFPAHYEANAQADASGGPATGTWFTDIFPTGAFASLGTVSISGDVLCLNANVHKAIWRGVITSSNTALAPAGLGVISEWIDNGEGANDQPDQQVGMLTSPPGPNPTCPNISLPTGPNLQGNLVVHDGI